MLPLTLLKKCTLLFWGVILTFQASAQFGFKELGGDIKEDLEYRFTEQKSENGFLGAEISVIDASLNGFNSKFNTGIRVMGNLGRFYARGGMDLSYLNGAHANTEYRSVYKKELPRKGHGLAGFSIFQRVTDKELGYSLETVERNKADVTYVGLIETPLEISYNIEGGYTKGFDHYRMNRIEMKGRLTDRNGEPMGKVLKPQVNGGNVASVLSYRYVAIGGSRMAKANTTVEIENYGKRSNKWYRRYFLHLLVGLKDRLDDVFLPYNTSQTGYDPVKRRHHIDDRIEDVNFGFRMGAEITSLGILDPVNWRVELGAIPGRGYLSHNLYFRFGLDLGIIKEV